MLVLNRKLRERIIIGKGIVVEVVEIGHGHVRLGILADRQVPVHRLEVWEKIQERKEQE